MSFFGDAFGQSMAPFGQLSLLLAFLTAVFGVVFGALGALKRQPRLTEAAVSAVYLFTGLITVAVLLLVYSLYTHDFSLKYVQQYSDATQPPLYLVTALWGGQAGSLLFWVFVLCLYGAGSFAANRERLRAILPHSIAVYMGVCIFFTACLLFKANPFEVQKLGAIPSDGVGLNPQLQTPLMSIHPPSLYAGYVGFTIPFAFAMGALLAGRFDSDWTRATRKATLISFAFLSIGNILGSWWAYEELGWGGFWAWDPVETAAFFPWLTGTAFLHSVMIQERRNMFRVWNVFLIAATFFLTILGTMLTRSGLVESVHSFANSKIGSWFGIFLLIIFLFSGGLIALRWKALRGGARDANFHVLSREFSFLANNVILTLMAITLVGFVLTPMFTKEILPWIKETVLGYENVARSEATMGPRFYNQYMAPLGLALLFLMGVGPLIPWRKATTKNLADAFLWPVGVGIAGTIAAAALGVRAWFPLAVFGLSLFVTTTVLQEFVQGTRIRTRTKGEGVPLALLTLVAKGRRRYGGYIVHLGMVAVFIGIAGSYYQGQRTFSNVPLKARDAGGAYDPARDWQESFAYGDFSFHYFDLRRINTEHTEEYRTYVAVKKDGEYIGTMISGRNWYRTHPDQPSTEIDTLSDGSSDLYISVGGFDQDSGEAVFTITYNPLIVWLWLGMMLILGGSLVCMAPEVQFVRVRSAAVATALFIGLALFIAAPAAMAQEPAGDHAGHDHPPAPAAGAGMQEISYPPIVMAAGSKLRCSCGCPHLLSQCTLGECGPGPENMKVMAAMAAKGASEEELIKWYTDKYGEKWRAVSPGDDLGAGLGMAVWVVAALGVAILGFLGMRLRRPSIKAAGQAPKDSSLSADDERRLAEELSRLE